MQAPLGPSIVDTADSPAPLPPRALPTARRAGRRAPCFADRDVLVASAIYHDLEQYSSYFGATDSAKPPRTTYGSCTVDNGEIRDAHGILVAELHCGLTVHVPGIIDDLGYEVGALGSDIAKERDRPDADALCWDEGDGHARCWFQTEHETAHYSFAATIDTRAGENGPLRGDDVRALFNGGTVARFTQRVYCH